MCPMISRISQCHFTCMWMCFSCNPHIKNAINTNYTPTFAFELNRIFSFVSSPNIYAKIIVLISFDSGNTKLNATL